MPYSAGRNAQCVSSAPPSFGERQTTASPSGLTSTTSATMPARSRTIKRPGDVSSRERVWNENQRRTGELRRGCKIIHDRIEQKAFDIGIFVEQDRLERIVLQLLGQRCGTAAPTRRRTRCPPSAAAILPASLAISKVTLRVLPCRCSA